MMRRTKKQKSKKNPGKNEKIHAWRFCPSGEHWVRTHSMLVPPSKKHPTGYTTTRLEHCARNPSGKDQLYPDEIQEIAKKYFTGVKKRPCPISLGFKNGKKYDDFIAGWVKYWNEIFNPKDPLNPDLVKALIATESSFDTEKLANKKNQNSARGLMQITNSTRKILGDENGELKDHFLTLTQNDLNNPNMNICAGVRWLFHKRKLASAKLGRDATWEEAVHEYKGGRTVSENRSRELMKRFSEKLTELQKCKNR